MTIPIQVQKSLSNNDYTKITRNQFKVMYMKGEI